MNLDGIWILVGGFLGSNQSIIIEGNELSRYEFITKSDSERKRFKFSIGEGTYMDDSPSKNLYIEGDTNRLMDYMVHEEEIKGKTVPVLSWMGMEYDGRGRIVMATFLREEDCSLVGNNFVSKACSFYNKVSSISSMRMPSNMGPGFMGLGGMMGANNTGSAGMMGANNTGSAGMMGANNMGSAGMKKVEPWNCSCGNKNNIGRFCTECGCPMPKNS